MSESEASITVIFVAPHPDDIEIFCGGTLLQNYAAGNDISMFCMTRGERGSYRFFGGGENLGYIRTKEMEKRICLLPGVRLVWLDFTNEMIECAPLSVEIVRQKLKEAQPAIIYLPESVKADSRYRHPDHTATGQIVEQAAKKLNCSITLRYYHTTRSNLLLKTDQHYKSARNAIRIHKSQHAIFAKPPFGLYFITYWQYRLFRKAGKKINCRYAEPFREVTVAKP